MLSYRNVYIGASFINYYRGTIKKLATDTSLLIGILVVVVVAFVVIIIYFICRSIFRGKERQKKPVDIYVKQRYEKKKKKITNTPYRVTPGDDSRISTDMVDDEIITGIKKSVKMSKNGKQKTKKTSKKKTKQKKAK